MAKDFPSIPEPLNRRLYFYDQVTQKSIHDLSRAIIEINADDAKLKRFYELNDLVYVPKPIEIYIDSFGGAVYQCGGIVGIIETSKTPIHTIAVGAAMSCGFIILISGHHRKAYKYATPMYHQISDKTDGVASDLEEELYETKRLQKFFEAIVLKRTNITKEELRENYERKQNWYFTSPKMFLKYGIVDEII